VEDVGAWAAAAQHAAPPAGPRLATLAGCGARAACHLGRLPACSQPTLACVCRRTSPRLIRPIADRDPASRDRGPDGVIGERGGGGGQAVPEAADAGAGVGQKIGVLMVGVGGATHCQCLGSRRAGSCAREEAAEPQHGPCKLAACEEQKGTFAFIA